MPWLEIKIGSEVLEVDRRTRRPHFVATAIGQFERTAAKRPTSDEHQARDARDTSGTIHGTTSTARITTSRFAGNVRLLTVFALLIAKV